MAKALEQVKQCFGRDAVIVNTRSGTRDGILGFGAKPFVEITAAPGAASLPLRKRKEAEKMRTPPAKRMEGIASGTASFPAPDPATAQSGVLSEVVALRSMVSELVAETRRSRVGELPASLFDTYQKLVANDVAEQISHQLVQDVRCNLTPEELTNQDAVRIQLAAAIERMLPTAGPIEITLGRAPKVVALVGPTGVGKTTTIAKLAANLCLREGRRVGLVTIDTYRIAAVEQLRTYAQIIDVPLEVAGAPDELEQALARMSDRDVVLIDTAGRSQRDGRSVRELQKFFETARPDEIHLVLSSTYSKAVLNETIDQFSRLGTDRIILTKLDEAMGFGVILSCLQKTTAKLSYVTTGQDVPEDIRIGEGRALAELILGHGFQAPVGYRRKT